MNEETPRPDEEPPVSKAAAPRLQFPDLVKLVFVDFIGFARQYLTESPPPLMFLTIWMIGMDTVAGGIELAYVAGEQYDVNNWFHAWLRIIVGGAAMGFIRYWAAGSIFHVVVLVAGGKGPARTSRYILLYALLPMSVCNLSIKILQMLIYGNKYFIGQTNGLLEGLFGMIMIGVYVYTVVLCYRGMCELQKTDRKHSILVLAGLSLAMIVLTVIGMGM